ncbi:MAG: hypothetical protein N3G22_03205 [Candidatus Micrarchaeota archaeon]|nr:hypothetical protein [Candidatus Micrarchaeota archaeon]
MCIKEAFSKNKKEIAAISLTSLLMYLPIPFLGIPLWLARAWLYFEIGRQSKKRKMGLQETFAASALAILIVLAIQAPSILIDLYFPYSSFQPQPQGIIFNAIVVFVEGLFITFLGRLFAPKK